MHILTCLTYYRPHVSGLTIYAERMARALTRRGHQVTILTSQDDRKLPRWECLDDITVVRVPPRMRVSKGLLMPGMPAAAWKLVLQADVVHLHLPQLDAAYIAWMGRLMRKPVVLTYHCDLLLPRGMIHAIANQVSNAANQVAAWGSDAIISLTRDYAEHSRFLSRHLGKVHILDAPVELAPAGEADLQAFREKFGIQNGQRIIGMAARMATEKGVEYLVQALPQVLKQLPQARVLFVGSYQDVVGENEYASRILALIAELKGHWSMLGYLSPVELTAFFKTCEVLVMPSLNSTEGFGLVQVEAMSCGTPVVATDLPGVRVPVTTSGMGKIVPRADAGAIAQAILDILGEPGKYQNNTLEVRRKYSPDVIAEGYENLFKDLLKYGLRRKLFQ